MAFNPETYGFFAQYDGTSESGDTSSGKSTLRYHGPWSQRRAFIKNLLGYRTITGNVQGSYTITTVPAYKYPAITDLAMYAMSYAVKSAGPCTGDPTLTGDQVAYQNCFVDVNFSTPDYQIGEGANADGGINGTTYLKESGSLGVEMLITPQSVWKFVSDGKKVDSEVGIPFPTEEYNITRFLMPFVPRYQADLCRGKVNNALFRGYAAGTLLFLGMEYDQGEVDANGLLTYQIDYKFSCKLTGWNKIMRPDTGVFDTLVLPDGVTNPVASANFLVLP
ncbi:MAG: hypothetical protein JWN86_1780 [Planctomycetota bacterium]|nr:hypothetical protein [Planctomycetota bacterium]